MKTRLVILLAALFTLSTGIQAQNWKKNNNRRTANVERRYSSSVRVSPPRHVKTVTVLPHGYSPIRYNNVVYYYANGYYYRPTPNRYYEVVLPSIGMIVPHLPVYQRVRYNGRTYYAYQNHLYSKVRTPYGINFRVDIRL